MDYSLKWSKASKLFAELEKQGGQLGKNAAAKPELVPHLNLYWRAFNDLHRRRRYDGMAGPQPISYREIESYVSLKFPMDKDQVQRLVRYIEAMDDVFLADYGEKNKDKN